MSELSSERFSASVGRANTILRAAVRTALRWSPALVLALVATETLAGTVDVTGPAGNNGASGTLGSPNGGPGTPGGNARAPTTTPTASSNSASASGGAGGNGGAGYSAGGSAGAGSFGGNAAARVRDI